MGGRGYCASRTEVSKSTNVGRNEITVVPRWDRGRSQFYTAALHHLILNLEEFCRNISFPSSHSYNKAPEPTSKLRTRRFE